MAYGVVGEEDAVEGLGEGGEGLLAAVGLELALPDGDAVPSHCGYLLLFLDVSLFVAVDFLFPEVGVGLGHLEVGASVMPMPKASVDEDDCTVFAQHDVGMAGESGMVEAIAEAAGPEILAHQYLWACSLALYCSHAAVALFLGHLVHICEIIILNIAITALQVYLIVFLCYYFLFANNQMAYGAGNVGLNVVALVFQLGAHAIYLAAGKFI